VKGKLALDEMIEAISDAKERFPTLRVAVFSGGEATMLKRDLTAAIAHATGEGLSTRIVSNGSWGKTQAAATKKVAELVAAGLKELNLSTGKDHQEWVPATSIMHCAVAAAGCGLFCLITIEADVEGNPHFRAVVDQPEIQELLKSRKIVIQSNSWMPFQESDDKRDAHVAKHTLRKGCGQIFDNIVVTPYREVSACCGLTLEYIPEMKLGSLDSQTVSAAYLSQTDDFLKYWIHTDGPYSIIEEMLGEERSAEVLKGVVHICQACVILHQNQEVRAKLSERHQEFLPSVMTRFFMAKAIGSVGQHSSIAKHAMEAE
jgi:hypothetical protein